MSVLHDFTKRKEDEAERARLAGLVEVARGRLADAFRQAPAFICVLPGPAHVFEMTNERYDHLTGRRRVLGLTVRAALPEREGQGFFKLRYKVYATGEAFVGSNMRVMLNRQLDHAPEERYIDFVDQAVEDSGGAITGIVVVGVDATDRKRADNRLRARLPILLDTSQPEAPGFEGKLGASWTALRILVVDDSQDGANSMSEMLDLMGHKTLTAYDGEQGVDIANEFQPDVILFDIGMPKLNGYEACRRTREAGFDHHLVKPVDPQVLMQILAGLDVVDEGRSTKP